MAKGYYKRKYFYNNMRKVNGKWRKDRSWGMTLAQNKRQAKRGLKKRNQEWAKAFGVKYKSVNVKQERYWR